ncbi:MAG TPA: 2-hydroxyglutaryl-CoA dehydratase [Clostridia bacterium]|nr:2-hydroxyglutaryl-CoA dehydratase [Clostridia bacterium]
MKKIFLGIDVGSVSTNLVLLDQTGHLVDKIYLRTQGQPIATIQKGLSQLQAKWGDHMQIAGVGTTGSARHLVSVLIGADIVKNEITAHAVAASELVPGVQTVLEIGGQDSKLIILRDGVVTDFAMNTVCAAGTGSFLDQQAHRLGLPIEEFGKLALRAKAPVRIAGRCTVFAETDMIHKQQMGHPVEEIVAGLCQALVRNFLSNLGKGKELLPPVVFQGGVAANAGIRDAFEKALETEIIVPEHYNVMGAIGMAILAREEWLKGRSTNFKGFGCATLPFRQSGFECQDCPNGCEIIQIKQESTIIARWGDRCGKWSSLKAVGTGA